MSSDNLYFLATAVKELGSFEKGRDEFCKWHPEVPVEACDAHRDFIMGQQDNPMLGAGPAWRPGERSPVNGQVNLTNWWIHKPGPSPEP